MKAIVTKRNPDGSYDEVGMNNRAVTPTLNKQGIRRWAKEYSPVRPYRIEYFHSMWEKAFEVEFHRHIQEEESCD